MASIIQQTATQESPATRDSFEKRRVSHNRSSWWESAIEIALNGKLFLPFACLISLGLRFWVLAQVEILSRDGFYYCVVARKIQDGHWLAAAQGWFIFNPYPPLIGLVAKLTGWSIEYSGQFLCAAPSALGVIPIFFWVKSAFSRRIAVVTTLLYAFHPILIRNSGEVMREGLYWLTMLTAVYFLWESVKRRSIWRAILGGLAATTSMLTRIEGIAIFPLVLMWCLGEWCISNHNRRELIRLVGVGIFSCAMLPLTLVILNVSLLPKGSEWQGIGRFQHLVQLFIDQIGDADEAAVRRSREKDRAKDEEDGKFQLASFETFRVSRPEEEQKPVVDQSCSAAPLPNPNVEGLREGTNNPIAAGMEPEIRIGAPRDVRDLAKSLPVWDKDCVADPVWYRLQRFLVMADDQAEAVYLGVFANRLIQGLLVPVLALFYFGIRYQKGKYWQGYRDWPLVFQTVMLFGVFYFHLTTEHVLEPRYLFCLMPFVFPWTAVGTVMLLDRIKNYLAECDRLRAYPKIVLTVSLMTATAAIVHATPRNDIEKTVQKQMGEHIRAHDGFGRRMVAPESLKRMAYYADTWYHMLPRQVSEIGPWLEANPMDYVVLGGKELPLYARLIPQLDAHPGYERIFTGDKRFRRYFIYRSRALGSFSAPDVSAENRVESAR